MQIQAIKTSVFRPNQNLARFITQHIKNLPNGSVLAITSKIVALAEGRLVSKVDPTTKARLIRSESTWVRRTKYVWLTIRDGMFAANAGIDESNADGKLILLPKDSFLSADRIRRKLIRYYKIKQLGIIITDSRIMPLRAGVLGVAVGYAGFMGLRDYRGRPDIFGQNLKLTQTDVADSLATACTVLMGEGDECQPLALITSPPVKFIQKVDKNELRIDPEDDLYLPLVRGLG